MVYFLIFAERKINKLISDIYYSQNIQVAVSTDSCKIIDIN